MFKVGIYSIQQNLIVILLAAILAVQLWPKHETPQMVTHPVGTLVSPAVYTEDVETPEGNMRDYQIELQDNGTKITLYDGNKAVHVFDRRDHPNCELFKRIDMDNE